MTGRIAENSQRKTAKIVGIAWLLIIITGVFAEFIVRSSLIVPDDVAATARNIMESESLFRIGIASDILMITFDVVVAVALYTLFKPVNRSLALVATSFRLVQAAVLGVNVLSLFAALQFLSGAEYLNAFESDQLHAVASSFLETHAIGYSVGLVFFSLSIGVLSYILFKSRSVPGVLAVMLAFGALVYLVGSFMHVLAPEFVEEFEPAYILPFVAELSLAIWLVVKGVNVQQGARRNVAAVAAAG